MQVSAFEVLKYAVERGYVTEEEAAQVARMELGLHPMRPPELIEK